MTVEAIEQRKGPLGERRTIIEIPQNQIYHEFPVCVEKSDALHEQVSLLAQILSPNVVGVFSPGEKGRENVIAYIREEINDANLRVEIPVHILGIKVPFIKREAQLRWRKTQFGDYPLDYEES